MRINSYNKFFAEVAKIMSTDIKAVKQLDGRYKVELSNHVYLNVYRGVSGSLFVHDHRGIAHITSVYDFDDFKTLTDLYERLVTDYSSSEETINTETTHEPTCKKVKPVIYNTFGQFPTISDMYNNKCFCCPADRQGNRCGGEKWCKETWKRYEAIIKPDWHHVSLATLANIDNDMLDEKRSVYMKIYRMTANIINTMHKCNKLSSIDTLRRRLISTVEKMWSHKVITYSLVHYVKAKIDNCYLVNTIISSKYAETYSYKSSRAYKKVFYI